MTRRRLPHMTTGSPLLEGANSPADCTDLGVALATAAGHGNPDRHGDFPDLGIQTLAELGFLHAPLTVSQGGAGLAGDSKALFDVLRIVGRSDLALGRLYEGHVNALYLVELYGTPDQQHVLRLEADCGRISGVWNAQAGPGVHMAKVAAGGILSGSKIWASGAAHIRRPIVTASADDQAGPVIVMPLIAEPDRVDTSAWRPHGMRASETGSVDFDGLEISEADIVGRPGDYYKSPHFSGGAWRVLAVQLGGAERIYDHLRQQLIESGRDASAYYRSLLGEAAIALETARLWASKAAVTAGSTAHHADIDAFVNLARSAFERAVLDVMRCAQRALGLNALMEDNPIERLVRDLSTYLRQPAPDRAIEQAVTWLLGKPSFGCEPVQQ